MLTLPSSVRVYVAAEPADLRKSFDGLSSLVAQRFGADPLLCVAVLYVARRPSASGLVDLAPLSRRKVPTHFLQTFSRI